jgi:hypothetical protein
MIDIQIRDRSASGFVPVKNPTDEFTHIRVSISFQKGGINYFNYKEEPKGYWISVSPVRLEKKDYGSFWTTLLSKGFRHFLEAAPRFNQKKLDSLFTQVQADINSNTGVVTDIMNKVTNLEKVAV